MSKLQIRVTLIAMAVSYVMLCISGCRGPQKDTGAVNSGMSETQKAGLKMRKQKLENNDQ
ncbi:MAG: hypothetical protein ABJA67_06635 [Chthonomonadales bacterium]